MGKGGVNENELRSRWEPATSMIWPVESLSLTRVKIFLCPIRAQGVSLLVVLFLLLYLPLDLAIYSWVCKDVHSEK